MANYKFSTVWNIKAPIEKVWDALFDIPKISDWWHSIIKVDETIKGFENGTGSLSHYTLKGFLPHQIKFCTMNSEVVFHKLIVGEIYGDIKGSIRWEFVKDKDHNTTVICTFKIHDTKPLTYFSGFLLFPLYKKNFRFIFKRGEENLNSYLSKQQ